MKSKLIYPIPSHGILMGIPWDGMGWDRHELLWNGMEQKNMSHGQASKLLKKKLMTSFKKYKHMKMCIA